MELSHKMDDLLLSTGLGSSGSTSLSAQPSSELTLSSHDLPRLAQEISTLTEEVKSIDVSSAIDPDKIAHRLEVLASTIETKLIPALGTITGPTAESDTRQQLCQAFSAHLAQTLPPQMLDNPAVAIALKLLSEAKGAEEFKSALVIINHLSTPREQPIAIGTQLSAPGFINCNNDEEKIKAIGTFGPSTSFETFQRIIPTLQSQEVHIALIKAIHHAVMSEQMEIKKGVELLWYYENTPIGIASEDATSSIVSVKAFAAHFRDQTAKQAGNNSSLQRLKNTHHQVFYPASYKRQES